MISYIILQVVSFIVILLFNDWRAYHRGFKKGLQFAESWGNQLVRMDDRRKISDITAWPTSIWRPGRASIHFKVRYPDDNIAEGEQT